MKAFEDGYAAYLACKPVMSNPYPKHTEERHEWFLGYECAKADTELD